MKDQKELKDKCLSDIRSAVDAFVADQLKHAPAEWVAALAKAGSDVKEAIKLLIEKK